jgi:predicted nucleotidyltransferase
MDIEKLKKEIVERLKPLNPEKIILFGSYAYGKPGEDSDIDLYVVTSDDFMPKTWSEKSELHHKISNYLRDIIQAYPTDLLVHTKKMYEKFRNLNSSFYGEIENKGIVLWEKN